MPETFECQFCHSKTHNPNCVCVVCEKFRPEHGVLPAESLLAAKRAKKMSEKTVPSPGIKKAKMCIDCEVNECEGRNKRCPDCKKKKLKKDQATQYKNNNKSHEIPKNTQFDGKIPPNPTIGHPTGIQTPPVISGNGNHKITLDLLAYPALYGYINSIPEIENGEFLLLLTKNRIEFLESNIIKNIKEALLNDESR